MGKVWVWFHVRFWVRFCKRFRLWVGVGLPYRVGLGKVMVGGRVGNFGFVFSLYDRKAKQQTAFFKPSQAFLVLDLKVANLV